MGSLSDFWRYGVVKTARKLKAAALSPVLATRGDGPVRSAYGVLMVPNWQDTTFRYCIFGTYGSDLSDLLLGQREEFVFVDIGANQGLYSLIAAQNPKCRQIIAFEPVPVTHARLAANVGLNGGAERTVLHQLAIADSVGVVPKVCVPGLLKVMVWLALGVTLIDAADAGPVPAELVAVTVKV